MENKKLTISEDQILFAVVDSGHGYETIMRHQKGERAMMDTVRAHFALLSIIYPSFEAMIRSVVEVLDKERPALEKELDKFDTTKEFMI